MVAPKSTSTTTRMVCSSASDIKNHVDYLPVIVYSVLQILLRTMKITIVPLAICFVFGWLAGWFGHWLWVDIGKRERAQREREAKPRS